MTLTVNIRLERHVPASLMALRVGNKFEAITGDIDDFQRCNFSNRCTIKTDGVLGALESLGNGFGSTNVRVSLVPRKTKPTSLE